MKEMAGVHDDYGASRQADQRNDKTITRKGPFSLLLLKQNDNLFSTYVFSVVAI